jgi:hypothetical protein
MTEIIPDINWDPRPMTEEQREEWFEDGDDYE